VAPELLAAVRLVVCAGDADIAWAGAIGTADSINAAITAKLKRT